MLYRVNVLGGLPRGGVALSGGLAEPDVLREGEPHDLPEGEEWVRLAVRRRQLVGCDEKGRPLAPAPRPTTTTTDAPWDWFGDDEEDDDAV